MGGINPQTQNQVDLVLLLNKVAVRSIKHHLLSNFGKKIHTQKEDFSSSEIAFLLASLCKADIIREKECINRLLPVLLAKLVKTALCSKPWYTFSRTLHRHRDAVSYPWCLVTFASVTVPKCWALNIFKDASSITSVETTAAFDHPHSRSL